MTREKAKKTQGTINTKLVKKLPTFPHGEGGGGKSLGPKKIG